MSVTTIPSGSQDTVWDSPTCLMGHLSSCFVLSDIISDLQVRLLYELGPNQYALNWLDIVEMSDIKSKMVLHYDAKCARDLTCYDLSHNRINGKFSGSTVSCDNFKVRFFSFLFKVYRMVFFEYSLNWAMTKFLEIYSDLALVTLRSR